MHLNVYVYLGHTNYFRRVNGRRSLGKSERNLYFIKQSFIIIVLFALAYIGIGISVMSINISIIFY